jgi:hypothetical protein
VTSAKTFSRRGLIIDLNFEISLIVLLWEGKGGKILVKKTGFLAASGVSSPKFKKETRFHPSRG